MMATSWKSQQGKGEYALQFETDDEGKYKLVEKAAQMAMDGKTIDDLAVWEKSQFSGRSGFYSVKDVICSECKVYSTFPQDESRPMNYCPNCGAELGGRSEV